MTAQRRPRRHSPVPDQQERLRALTLDASPAARRLRARIPRPPVDPAPPSDGPPVPSAPYAVAARTPYRPPDSGGAPPRPRGTRPAPGEARVSPDARPGRDPGGLLPVPPSDTTPTRPVPERRPASSREPAGSAGDGASRDRAREAGPGPWHDPTEGRHRRPARPPSGYTEFAPEPPDPLLERLARRWAPNAVLSRRAVLALLVLGALAVALVLALHDRPTTVSAPEMVTRAASAEHPAGEEGSGASETAEAAAAQEDLVVHVGGEVEDAGLYTLPPGSRVADAVEEAGGAVSGADLDLLNLARPLVDGEQVLVGVPPPAGGAGAAGAGSQGIGGPVDVNRADKALLETLPGIGPVIADNIIAYREEHGPFASVEDLVNVSKIGEKVLDTLGPHVTAG
ncbi:helix-hairpin-helix domain-containing protein [Nocardiopsis quinghaiensis]|uniref:helix-hairpin-helix domain-containing protein n=1 Tax=Nocardiopsis quinghaiensis TaxID=464995 RepID=UPI001239C295|nr:helix-hairpin-helix domain-containing protein [Nocardiopsis quinghaiensis]